VTGGGTTTTGGGTTTTGGGGGVGLLGGGVLGGLHGHAESPARAEAPSAAAATPAATSGARQHRIVLSHPLMPRHSFARGGRVPRSVPRPGGRGGAENGKERPPGQAGFRGFFGARPWGS